jgi:non-canonical purine NTP pyrophosphatase (RdgB/HAM1 family)
MILRFVTSNKDKLREASTLLRRPLLVVNLELDEIQTVDLEQLVRHKANQAFRRIRAPLIVEDTALGFKAWGGLPGPFIKFFVQRMGLTGLVDALEPFDEWDAEALCGVGFHDGERLHYFEGRTEGTIVAPAGRGGFGWDSIFVPKGAAATFADMTPEEKNRYSMRGQAMRALAEHLASPRAALNRTFPRRSRSPNPSAPPDPA